MKKHNFLSLVLLLLCWSCGGPSRKEATNDSERDTTAALLDTTAVFKNDSQSIDKESLSENALVQDLNRLRPGRIVFNPPEVMEVGKTERVEIRISRDTSGNMLVTLKDKLKGAGKVQQALIKTSALMSVKLQGTTFKIVPLSSETQPVTRQDFSQWNFEVTPQEGGRHELYLYVSVKLRNELYGEANKDFPVMEKEIEVKVNSLSSLQAFFAGHWEWLFSTLLIPLVLWLRTRSRKKTTS